MKFGETLKENLIPEWASQYLDYDALKLIIDEVKLQKESQNGSKLLSEQFEHEFYRYLSQVQDFFFVILENETNLVIELERYAQIELPAKEKRKYVSTMSKNCREVFKSLEMLKNFGAENATGFKKIYKKYKKNAVIALGIDVDAELDQSGFNDPAKVEEIEHRVEKVFCLVQNLGDLTAARKELFSYQANVGNRVGNRERYLVASGVFAGISLLCALAFVQILVDGAYQDGIPVAMSKLSRIFFVLAAMLIFLAAMLHVFERKRVNYIFILELPPSKVTSGFRVIYFCGLVLLLVGSLLGIALVCSVNPRLAVPLPFGVLFNLIFKHISPYWIGTALMFLLSLGTCVKFFRMINGHLQVQRMVEIFIFKLLTPWNHRVTFPLFFTADILTSLGGVISDFLDALFLGVAPEWLQFVVSALPSCIRACECVMKYRESRLAYPHLANFAKYAASVPSFLLKFSRVNNGVPKIVFNCWRFAELSYKLYWDVFQDFACFSGGFGGREFRDKAEKWRDRIICRRPSSFSAAEIWTIVISDLVMRYVYFSSLLGYAFCRSRYFNFALQVVELLRRYMWGLLRLDNQQATNCEGYLTTNFVPLLLPEKERISQSLEKDESQSAPRDIVRYDRALTMNYDQTVIDQIRMSRASRCQQEKSD